jgi:hypothetical protein
VEEAVVAMATVRVASFNVENLFCRPRAFTTTDWEVGAPVLAAHREFNTLIGNLYLQPG